MYNAPVAVSVIDDDTIPVIRETEFAAEAFTVVFGSTVSVRRNDLNDNILQRVFQYYA